MRKLTAFTLTTVWALGVYLAYLVGQNVHDRRVEQHIHNMKREAAKQRTAAMRGRMGPGDTDPRGNG